MKKFKVFYESFLPLFLILLISQFVYGQTKFDEYEPIDSDSESARIDNFTHTLNENPESKGLIVVYSGDDLEQIGNITAYIEGAKYYISTFRAFEKDRISFVIGKGKTKLYKEFWILPDETTKPPIPLTEVNLNNLEGKFLYASSCIGCEPAVPALSNDRINLENYLRILTDNPKFEALVVIHRPRRDNDAGKYFMKRIKQLIKKEKIDSARIHIKSVKAKENEVSTADFYLISKKKI